MPPAAVYLDYNATTPLDARVLDGMMPFLGSAYGNPSSQHALGREAAEAVELARGQVASLIGARSAYEIVFTSGATEANNLALIGITQEAGHKRHIVTGATEHKAVLETVRALTRQNFELTMVPVDQNGVLDIGLLRAALRPDTLVVSVMGANNETGTLGPIREVGELCQRSGALFHCDAAQLVGKLPINVDALGIDLLSISAHKIYGPKGTGALYIRRCVRNQVAPILHGGGQEQGLRSGTLNVPGCVGFGAAAAIAEDSISDDCVRIERLRSVFLDELQRHVREFFLNGHPWYRLPGTLNLHFPGVEADSLVWALRDVAISSGSACTEGAPEPSHVLLAMGMTHDAALDSVRISIGRPTNEAEVRFAASRIGDTIRLLTDKALTVKEALA